MTHLQISSKILEDRLYSQDETIWLIGKFHENIPLALGAACADKIDRSHDFDTVTRNLPVGIEILGIASPADSLEDCIAEGKFLLDKFKDKATDFVILSLKNRQAFQISSATERRKLEIQISADGEKIASQFQNRLLQLQLPLILEVPLLDDFGKDCQTAFDKLRSDLGMEDSQFFVMPPDSSVPQRLEDIEAQNSAECKFSEQPVPLQMLIQNSQKSHSQLTAEFTPFPGGPKNFARARLKIDVLIYLPENLAKRKSSVCSNLRKSIQNQLDQLEEILLERKKIENLSAMHFFPTNLQHHITIIKSEGELESSQESVNLRRELHEKWLLQTDRPLLRRENAFTWDKTQKGPTSNFLQNVHEGVQLNGVKNPEGKIHTIWGSYTYHHYMQDNFNDSGWGCAYRSLQTIWSWMQHQNYTNKSVPSHKIIQQTLVDIGDKEGNFVGSKQWIGAIELGFVLETLIGIGNKVITVRSGSEMDSKAPEIAHHFDTQGTPIMIGGGVLAYTLLGIYYDADLEECQYLILDPHYTGADDLKKIQNGKWVAWKKSTENATAGGKLFVPKAFYNLLCPQRPRTV